MNARLTRSALGAALLCLALGAQASSHREAPFITTVPKVDATDFYMFNSYEAGRTGFVTLIANYQPLQDGYGGPNYFSMDPNALYEIHIDNVGDAKEHLSFQFRFKNKLSNNGTGTALSIGGKMVDIPLIQSGAVSNVKDANLQVNESYTLTVVRGDRRGGMAQAVAHATTGATTFDKPVDNIGKKTIADYAAYAAKHVYPITIPGCATPAKVFVGQRQDPFAVNLGTIFDLVNAPVAVITDPSLINAVPNTIGDKNVTTLALEVHKDCLKASASGDDVIGGWTTASLRQGRLLDPKPGSGHQTSEKAGGAWVQVSRLGMPLVNEVVIGLKDKDKFNSSKPKDDAQFADYVTNPALPKLLEVLFGSAGVMAPTTFPRADLVTAFLTGIDGVNKDGSTAEVLRLNTAIAAIKAGQNNLGAAPCFVNGVLTTTGNANCDPAGFPNGRRPGDDVTDIALRAMMGFLLPPASAPSGQLGFTDGVLQDASQFDVAFPYLKTPLPGSSGPTM